MPIRRPDDSKFLSDQSIDAIRVVRSLADGVIKQAAEAVKAEMIRRKLDYVESDRVIGEMRGGAPGTAGSMGYGAVEVRKLWKLVKDGELEEPAFFDSVVVDKAELAKFLGGEQINALCKRVKIPGKGPTPYQLQLDFKLPYFLDVKSEDLGDLLAPALKRVKKAAA